MSQSSHEGIKTAFVTAGEKFPGAVETYFKAFEMAAIVGALAFAADKTEAWEIQLAATSSFAIYIFWIGWTISSIFPDPQILRRRFKNRYLMGAIHAVLIGISSAICAQVATRVAYGVIVAFMK